MSSDCSIKKILQVHEEVAPALHMPIIVANEIYIVTQQDVRRVEDTRYISYNRINLSGQLMPVAPPIGPIVGTTPATPPPSNTNSLQALVEHCQKTPQISFRSDENMELEFDIPSTQQRSNIANIPAQLKWAKLRQSASPFMFKYSTATSTCKLLGDRQVRFCSQCTAKNLLLPSTSPSSSSSPPATKCPCCGMDSSCCQNKDDASNVARRCSHCHQCNHHNHNQVCRCSCGNNTEPIRTSCGNNTEPPLCNSSSNTDRTGCNKSTSTAVPATVSKACSTAPPHPPQCSSNRCTHTDTAYFKWN